MCLLFQSGWHDSTNHLLETCQSSRNKAFHKASSTPANVYSISLGRALRIYSQQHPTIMAPAEIAPARKYRSRKQKPCDNCRRRRVCCVRDAEGDCALCSRRSIPCTFSSEPSPRKRRPRLDLRPPSKSPVRQEPGPSQNGASGHVTPASKSTDNAKRKSGGEAKYIGLTGTDDVYFVVERDQGIGNDPAREAYFRVWIFLRVNSSSISNHFALGEGIFISLCCFDKLDSSREIY